MPEDDSTNDPSDSQIKKYLQDLATGKRHKALAEVLYFLTGGRSDFREELPQDASDQQDPVVAPAVRLHHKKESP